MSITKIKLPFLFVLIFSFSIMHSYAQSYWMQDAGGTTIDEGYSISLDDSANTYTTGYFSTSAKFGPSITINATGVSDMFLTKTNSKGIFQWAIHGGGVGNVTKGLAVKTDANGNSYVTGFFYGTATFGSFNLTSAGAQDVFIAKYDRNGNILWAKSAGGPMSDIGNAITFDNSGNVIVTGEFAGTAMFGTFSLTSTKSNINVFTTKLDGNGNFLWAQSGVGPHTDRGLGVACDGAGNIYVTGQFTDTITFNSAHFSSLYNAIFLIKYNSAGVEQWFTKAGGGTVNIANSIAVDNSSNVLLTGNFVGTLSFFATTTVTLTPKYTNGIFVAKYNSSGGLLWDVSDASQGSVTSNCISLDNSGNAYIIGNFECRMSSYADQYGQGTFNTVGYWDIFVAEYTAASGAWQWSRQIGGQKDNLGYSLAVSPTADIFTTGSFNQDMTITSDAFFIGYNTSQEVCNSTYCSDNDYGDFQTFNTKGNYDIFIAKPIDLLRQPYDYYLRSGSACLRPFEGVCINNGCPDTVTFCGSGSINAVSNTCPTVGPQFNYLWSTGQVGGGISVNKQGWYSVTQTSVDGCFQSTDSIYVVIHTNPTQPNISDNVVINTNATNPKPIEVCEHPVILTGGGYGTNKYSWSGGMTATTLSITVTKSGNYCFDVVNSFGCTNSTCVQVTIDSMLKPIIPKLVCYSCKNDTAAFCKGSSFSMLTYDSITDPLGNPSPCLPTPSSVSWFATPGTISYFPGPGAPCMNNFTPSDSGWYHITDTIKRENTCDTLKYILHDSVYVRLYPIPAIGPVSVLGSTSICPGDSAMLIAVDTGKFVWSTGSTKDSIWVKPGTYSITSSVTNSYGCSASASASGNVTVKSPPTISINPTSGVICPGDSILLSCTGGAGNYKWQGPSGTIGIDTPFVYVKTAGTYYCIVSDTSYCNTVLSNTAAITNYATPYLAATPNNVICPHDTVRIHVVASQGSSITWLSPLSGSDSVQAITVAGTYSCIISSCGINTTASITVISSTPLATITPSGSTTFCAGDSITLTANNGMAVYVWNPGGISGKTITPKSSGIYTLITTDSYGCIAKDSVNIKVTPNNAVPPLVSDTAVCPGESAVLVATGSGNFTWYSSPSGGAVLGTGTSFTTPIINTTTTFYVSAELGDCQSARDSVNVGTTDCSGIFVPNVFTPNGDGKNDSWIVTIKGARCFDCKIYNRWGVLIYQWNDISKGWDGVVQQTGLPASDGTYYYIINFCDYLNNPGKRDGFITLIRNQ